MKDRLESLRLFFPAEVTAAYLSIQGLLASRGIQSTEFTELMFAIAIVLAAINAVIYWKWHRTNIVWIAVLTLGFMIWVINIDMPRFRDLLILGEHIEIVAPVSLIFYTLITSFLELPRASK